MTSFQTFVQAKFQNLSQGMQEVYGSLEAFKSYYIANHGMTPWLETLRGQALPEDLVESTVKTYITDMGRTTEEIPSILVHICRQYNVELPVVEGILTEAYWAPRIAA